jgi:hypothetical protein
MRTPVIFKKVENSYTKEAEFYFKLKSHIKF